MMDEKDFKLISSVLDGSANDEDFAALNRRLENEPELRAIYIQLVDQEVELQFADVPETSSGVLGNSPNKNWLLPALATCALVLVFVVAELFNGTSNDTDQTVETKETIVPPDSNENSPRRPVPFAPSEWLADFEQGLPRGWEAEWTSEDLPTGSTGAIRTTPKIEGDNPYRTIKSPMAWAPGHVQIGLSTHIHLTAKIEGGKELRLFMLTHVPNPDRSEICLYSTPHLNLDIQPGKWYQISIPFSQFRRKDQQRQIFIPGPPEEGEVAWSIFTSTIENQTLVIDQWKVDQVGTGYIVVKQLAP